jgi:hypothetical protein
VFLGVLVFSRCAHCHAKQHIILVDLCLSFLYDVIEIRMATRRIQIPTHLVHTCCSTLHDLHFISQINKVLIGALFLLGNKTIPHGTNDKSICKLEWDAKESTFWDLVESHLLEQIINTRDRDGGREKVRVLVGGVRDQDALPRRVQ